MITGLGEEEIINMATTLCIVQIQHKYTQQMWKNNYSGAFHTIALNRIELHLVAVFNQ